MNALGSLLASHDIYRTFRFMVVIQDYIVIGCSKVSGIQKSFELETYREGGRNDYVHSLPKYTNTQKLVLERGVSTFGDSLADWVNDCFNDKITKKNITIDLMNGMLMNKKWHIEGAYPVSWTAPDLNAMNSEIAFEKLEFVCNRITTV